MEGGEGEHSPETAAARGDCTREWPDRLRKNSSERPVSRNVSNLTKGTLRVVVNRRVSAGGGSTRYAKQRSVRGWRQYTVR